MSAEGRTVASRHVTLTYADTDAAGILYFAAWFPWMERVSVEWAHGKGFRFDRMLEEYGAAPVTRMTSCEYTAAARVYDEVEIAMRVRHVGKTSYRLGFTMTRCPGPVVVARSTLALVCVDGTGRAAPIPAEYRLMLQEACDE
jgi:acyl-CoA thioester hydrolase